MASFFVVYNKSVYQEPAVGVPDILDVLPESYVQVYADNKIGFTLEEPSESLQSNDQADVEELNGFYYDEKTGCCVVADARIDYKQELVEKLGNEQSVTRHHSDSRLILFAYLKWGEDCLEHLFGDFAFVIWNPEEEMIFIARDHFGCKPLYYLQMPGFIAVSSNTAALMHLPGFKPEVREQYVLDAICLILRRDDKTAYERIFRIKPSHFMKFAAGRTVEQYRYWDLKVDSRYSGFSLEEAVNGLRGRIIESVRQRTPSGVQVGVELSGGLDSSGIASVLVAILGKNRPLYAYTHSISPEGAARHSYLKSELEYSKTIADTFDSIRQFIVTEEDASGSYGALINQLEQELRPVNQTYALQSDLLFESAGKSSISVMFSGLGGDEGITNSGGAIFNELIKEGRHSELRENISTTVHRQGGRIVRKLIRHYLKHYAPWTINLYQKDWRVSRYRSFAIQKSLARKYRMKRRFFRNSSFPDNPDIRAIQYTRLMHPNIPGRIEETSLLAQKYGVEYRYPFLDVKLLEFFYSLPSEYKYRDGQGRYLFRKAMEGILPDKVRLRGDKDGMTVPNVAVRVQQDVQIFREIIEDGRQKNKFHYVDYQKLDKMLDTFQNTDKIRRLKVSPREILSPISVLILQKWQREGIINIRIKC
jgi:asparagine synthase (glutamine-hydrolysing)